MLHTKFQASELAVLVRRFLSTFIFESVVDMPSQWLDVNLLCSAECEKWVKIRPSPVNNTGAKKEQCHDVCQCKVASQ